MQLNTLITKEQIAERVKELGEELSKEYVDRCPLVIGVLKGAFIFTADLVRAMNTPVEVDFIRFASYEGTQSTGNVRLIHDLTIDCAGRDILVVEDIVDTGQTLEALIRILKTRRPKSLKICALLAHKDHVNTIDFVGFQSHEGFVVGYGLDLYGRYRELPHIASVHS
ncbi:MAG: hypoxanthine phosphoribosyltransferase [Oligoflexales bacterium]